MSSTRTPDSRTEALTRSFRPSAFRHRGGLPADAETKSFLPRLWRVTRRRWKLAVTATSLVLLLGGLAYMLSPTRYESAARVQFSFDSADMMQLADTALGSLGSNDEQTKLSTQVQILQSRDLILAVVGRLDLARNPKFYKHARPGIDSQHLDAFDEEQVLKEFGRRLSVKMVPKTYLVDIGFRNQSPDLARQILGELISQHIRRTFEARFYDTQQAAEWLQQQVASLRSDVEKNQRRLFELQREKNLLLLPSQSGPGTSPSQPATAASLELGEVIKAGVAAQADRIDKEAKYRASLTGDPELIASIVPESKIVILRTQQAATQADLARLTSQFGPQYPSVITDQNQLKQLDQDIKREIKVLQEQLREQFHAAQKGEELLAGERKSTEREAFRELGAAGELVALQEEVSSGQRLYEDLQTKLKESSVLAGLKSVQMDVVSKPDLPYKQSEPDPLKFAAILLPFSLMFGLSLAVLRDSADHSLISAYEVEEAAETPVLGSLPKVAMGRLNDGAQQTRGSVVAATIINSPRARMTESLRSIRSELLVSSTERPQVMVITSSVPGEGKSSISTGLSMILAQRQATVLLVEADLRKPVLHRTFPAPRARMGLATVLSGNSSLEESIYPAPGLPNLSILPAGVIPPFPAELLDSDKMKHLIARLRGMYEFIVIDTPPLLSVTDALPLAAQADAVLLAVRSRITRRRALVDTCNILFRTGIQPSGIVLNDVSDIDGAAYYYGDYNSYYSDDSA